MATTKNAKITDAVISKIMDKLNNGFIPWVKPWEKWKSWSRGTGNDYTGVNSILLGGGEYITFKQCQKEGGKINKGAKSEQIAFYKSYDRQPSREEAEILKDISPKEGDIAKVNGAMFVYTAKGWITKQKMLKYYNAFNVATSTDLELKHDKIVKRHKWDSIEIAEKIFNEYTNKKNISVNYGSNAAYNAQAFTFETGKVISFNSITLPQREQFKGSGQFYETVFHELIHSTAKELNRPLGHGKKEYAREELVAEIGQAYIMSFLGIDYPIDNTAAYCRSWAKTLDEDKNAVLYAAPKALEAANHILNSVGIDTKEQ